MRAGKEKRRTDRQDSGDKEAAGERHHHFTHTQRKDDSHVKQQLANNSSSSSSGVGGVEAIAAAAADAPGVLGCLRRQMEGQSEREREMNDCCSRAFVAVSSCDDHPSRGLVYSLIAKPCCFMLGGRTTGGIKVVKHLWS